MSNFKQSIKAAFDFAETLPSAGTMLRPAANKLHILAARDGVFIHAVINAIFDARFVSETVDDFVIATDYCIDRESAEDLYATEFSRQAAEAFAEKIIKNYVDAENFAKHVLA